MLAEPLAAEAAPSARKETENQSYRIEALLAVERVSGAETEGRGRPGRKTAAAMPKSLHGASRKTMGEMPARAP